MIIVALSLLIFHGVVGGTDVLLNHEIVERLPSQVFARTEQALHSARELIFGLLFGSLAWFQWGGQLVWFIAVLLVAEILISLVDTLIEDRTRRLTATERTMHVILFINFGAYTTVLVPVLMNWNTMPTGLRLVDYGPWSWVLSALSVASIGWSIRDGISYRRLGNLVRGGHTTSAV